MASFSDAPRPAKAPPKPTRFSRAALRVLLSNVLLIASNSVCSWKQPSFACSGISSEKLAGSVGMSHSAASPSFVPSKMWPSSASGPVPRTISRYLRPKVER